MMPIQGDLKSCYQAENMLFGREHHGVVPPLCHFFFTSVILITCSGVTTNYFSTHALTDAWYAFRRTELTEKV